HAAAGGRPRGSDTEEGLTQAVHERSDARPERRRARPRSGAFATVRGRPGRGARHRGKDRAAARKASFASGSPIETRTPSPANGRTATPYPAQCSANAVVRSPRRSQTKFASVGGTVHPSAISASRTRDRSLITL